MSELPPEQEAWIEQLNSRATKYQEDGLAAYDAVEQAASDFKLNVLAESDMEGSACRVYETPDGTLVNCWIDEVLPSRKNPARRFDGQIQWFTRG